MVQMGSFTKTCESNHLNHYTFVLEHICSFIMNIIGWSWIIALQHLHRQSNEMQSPPFN